MSHYHHLSINEREKILVLWIKGQSLRSIAKEIGRSVSTVSRELASNSHSKQGYSAVSAEKEYHKRRRKCKRHKLLSNTQLQGLVKRLFLAQQWSPEQIANRLAHENNGFTISCSTIYRAIYAGMLILPSNGALKETEVRSGNCANRGKIRRRKGTVETRGKIVISNHIQQRPQEAESRQVIGHWEADTVVGKKVLPAL